MDDITHDKFLGVSIKYLCWYQYNIILYIFSLTPPPLLSSWTGHTPIHRMVIANCANYGREILIKLIHKSYIIINGCHMALQVLY